MDKKLNFLLERTLTELEMTLGIYKSKTLEINLNSCENKLELLEDMNSQELLENTEIDWDSKDEASNSTLENIDTVSSKLSFDFDFANLESTYQKLFGKETKAEDIIKSNINDIPLNNDVSTEVIDNSSDNLQSAEEIKKEKDTELKADKNIPKISDEKPTVITKKISASKKKKKIFSILSEVVFYLTIVIMLFTAFVYGANAGKAKNFLGFSYANVLTTSMQSEIPKGSFVLTRKVEASSLMVGDDITYITESGVTYTHRIVQIHEKYEGSKMRGFITQGIENPMPDKEVVFDGNVIGKVILTVPNLGSFLNYLKNNIFLVAGIFAIMMLLSVCLKVYLNENKKEKIAKQKTSK